VWTLKRGTWEVQGKKTQVSLAKLVLGEFSKTMNDCEQGGVAIFDYLPVEVHLSLSYTSSALTAQLTDASRADHSSHPQLFGYSRACGVLLGVQKLEQVNR
jgi:hypothetical protein